MLGGVAWGDAPGRSALGGIAALSRGCASFASETLEQDLAALPHETMGYVQHAGRMLRIDLLERFVAEQRALRVGRPRGLPSELLAELGYDSSEFAAMMRAAGFQPSHEDEDRDESDDSRGWVVSPRPRRGRRSPRRRGKAHKSK